MHRSCALIHQFVLIGALLHVSTQLLVSGEVLRAVTIHQPPFSFITRTPGGNTYAGFFFEMMENVVIESGLDIEFVFYEVPDGTFGVPSANGSWSGVVGELESGRADIAFGPLTITSTRITAVLFTSAYIDIGLELLVAKPKEQMPDVFSFLRPFRRDLWLCLVAVAIAMAIIGALIELLSPFPRKEKEAGGDTAGSEEKSPRKFRLGARNRNTPASDLEKIASVADRDYCVLYSINNRYFSKAHDLLYLTFLVVFSGALLNSFMTIVGQDGDARKSWSTRILLLAYFFFALIALSSYTANLTAFLTLRGSAPHITSMNDLRLSGKPFSVVANSAPAAFFDTPEFSVMKINMRSYPDIASATAAVRENEVAAFVYVDVILQYLASQPPCDSLLVGKGDDYGKGTYGIPLSRNRTDLWLPFSAALLRLRERGTVVSDCLLTFKYTAVCQKQVIDAEGDTPKSLTPSDLQGLFYFALIGIGAALLFLLFERGFILLITHWRAHVALATCFDCLNVSSDDD